MKIYILNYVKKAILLKRILHFFQNIDTMKKNNELFIKERGSY